MFVRQPHRQLQPGFTGIGRIEANQHIAESHAILPKKVHMILNTQQAACVPLSLPRNAKTDPAFMPRRSS